MNRRGRVSSVKALWALSTVLAAACASSNGAPGTEPAAGGAAGQAGSAPVGEPMVYSESVTVFAYSGGATDTEPSRVAIAWENLGVQCEPILFPGTTPMDDNRQVPCTVTGNWDGELSLSARYPFEPLPPRTAESPTEPPPWPTLPAPTCDEGRCAVGPVTFSDAPPFQYVAIYVNARTELDATLQITGAGRDVEIPVHVASSIDGAYIHSTTTYVNVDDPPAAIP